MYWVFRERSVEKTATACGLAVRTERHRAAHLLTAKAALATNVLDWGARPAHTQRGSVRGNEIVTGAPSQTKDECGATLSASVHASP